jgi:hypothetical protein
MVVTNFSKTQPSLSSDEKNAFHRQFAETLGVSAELQYDASRCFELRSKCVFSNNKYSKLMDTKERHIVQKNIRCKLEFCLISSESWKGTDLEMLL